MKIEQSISDLLYHHDCVIVNNFGGFVANYKNAHLHPAHHIFYPPSKKIAFNAGLKHNDGLLASYLSQKLDITYNEALLFIDHFVRQAYVLLEQGKKVHIDKVGSLYFDKEKKIQFEVDTTNNFLLDSYGLEPIHSPAIKRENLQHSLQKIKKPVANRVPNKKPIKKLWRIIELAPAAALLAFMLVSPIRVSMLNLSLTSLNPFQKTYYPSIEERIQKIKARQQSSAHYSTKQNEIVTEDQSEVNETQDNKEDSGSELLPDFISNDLTRATSDHVEEEKINAKPLTESSSAETTQHTNTDELSGYYIVTGCFRSSENANALVSKLNSDGFSAQIVDYKNNMHMVGIRYELHTEAESQLPVISKQYNGAWLFVKE